MLCPTRTPPPEKAAQEDIAMDSAISTWLNIATVLMMLGFITYLSILPYTTFWGDD